MSSVVYKYKLSWVHTQIIKGILKPLTVAMQNNEPHLWAEAPCNLDDDAGATIQLVRYGTGYTKMDDALIYLCTLFNAGYVWHYYYKYVNSKDYETT